MNTRCSALLSVSTGHVQRMGRPSLPCSITGITCPQGTGFTMPKVSLFPLGIPCIQGTGGQPHCAYGICLFTWHSLSLNSLIALESRAITIHVHPLMVLLGQLGTLRGCKLTASGTNLRASSCPTLPVPCQSSLPDAGKQVHLWSSSVAGCYFSVPGRAWPCPALALGVVAAM